MFASKKKIYVISTVCLLSSIFITVCLLYKSVKPHYTIIIDPRCSAHCMDEVRSFFTNCVPLSTYETQRQLLEQFPYIKSITLLKKSVYKTIVSIAMQNPVARINDRQVLYENALLMPQFLLDAQTCAHLPTLTVACPVDKELGSTLVGWLSLCDEELLRSHQITWISPSKIIISDNHNKKCLAHSNMVLTYENVQQGLQLLEQAMQQYHKKGGGLIADLRFKDQIIISKKRGDHEREIV